MAEEYLVVRGARSTTSRTSRPHPPEPLTVITGLSGSGKSSLAFDTIYAEGQRRYVESLSAYARQFLGLMEKPDVDVIEGLSPAISIEQKTTGAKPPLDGRHGHRDVRLPPAALGPRRRAALPQRRHADHQPDAPSQIADAVLAWPEGTRIEVLAPLVRGRKGEFKDLFEESSREGFVRVRMDGETYDLTEVPTLNAGRTTTSPWWWTGWWCASGDRESPGRLDRDGAARWRTAWWRSMRQSSGQRQAAANRVIFSERFACPTCGLSLPELEPRQFSFNSPFGACAECHGLGTRRT